MLLVYLPAYDYSTSGQVRLNCVLYWGHGSWLSMLDTISFVMQSSVTRPTRWQLSSRYATTLALLVALALYAGQVWLYRSFIVDDTFITFRYVQQWVHGNGLVYNIGERVEGYSNFLWIVLLAPFARFGVDLLLGARILGVVCGLLTLFFTWQIARRWPLAFVAPLLLAASAPFAAWTMGGLETPLFTLLLTASVYLFLREEEGQAGWFSGVAFGLLCITRPEGVVFAGIAVLFRLWWLWRKRWRLPEYRDWLRAVSLLLIVGVHLAWRLEYYGYPLPNTVYAKSMGLHPRALLEGGYYLYQCLMAAGGLWVVAVGVSLALVSPGRWFGIPYLFTSVAVYAVFVLAGGGDWMPMQRFLVNVLPLLWLLVHAGLGSLMQYLTAPPASDAGPGRAALRLDSTLVTGLVVLLVVGQVGYLLLLSLDQRFVGGGGNPGDPTLHPDLVYLREQAQPGDTVALVFAGFAYFLPLETRVIDMVGLTDAHIARRPAQFPSGLFGRGDVFGKWDVDYVLAQGPDYVQGFGPVRGSDGVWRTKFTGTTLLLNDPRFQREYAPLREPGGTDLFVRRQQ